MRSFTSDKEKERHILLHFTYVARMNESLGGKSVSFMAITWYLLHKMVDY